MTFAIDKLAKTLQTLWPTEADTATKESGMIQRRRKISGPASCNLCSSAGSTILRPPSTNLNNRSPFFFSEKTTDTVYSVFAENKTDYSVITDW
jgi:hypothetical protein